MKCNQAFNVQIRLQCQRQTRHLLEELLPRESTESESVMVSDKHILKTAFVPYSAPQTFGRSTNSLAPVHSAVEEFVQEAGLVESLIAEHSKSLRAATTEQTEQTEARNHQNVVHSPLDRQDAFLITSKNKRIYKNVRTKSRECDVLSSTFCSSFETE